MQEWFFGHTACGILVPWSGANLSTLPWKHESQPLDSQGSPRNDFQWRSVPWRRNLNGVTERINTLLSLSILLKDWLNSKINQKAREPVYIVSKDQPPEGRDQGGERKKVVLEKQTKNIWLTSQTTNQLWVWRKNTQKHESCHPTSHEPQCNELIRYGICGLEYVGSIQGASTNEQEQETSGQQLAPCL